VGNYILKHEENEGYGKAARIGKGWGMKTIANNKQRTKHISQRMSASEFTTFRPRVDNEGAYWVIRDWGTEDIPHLQSTNGFKPTGMSLSALFNCLLHGLSAAVQNTTQIDADGNISIEVNLGRINIR